ncbi:MAG: hypothetical protein HUU41_13600 [Bryobacteraceae bacterium]|nr:hypothetical protein [Bryobacteraceae bacterium]
MADQVSANDLCNARAIRDCIRDHASELYDGRIYITCGPYSMTVTVETGGGDPEGYPGAETIAVTVESDCVELSRRFCAYRRIILDDPNYDPFEVDDED